MRVTFIPTWRHTKEDGERFVAYAKSLGLPYVRAGRGLGRLAVVAGGPSIAQHEEELRDFTGEIWGVNGAFEWLHERGIKSTFFSLDPDDDVSHYPKDAKGLVASVCPTKMFDQLAGRHLTLFDVNCDGGIKTGVTSVTAAPMLAAFMGYAPVIFYGCEGSFGESTHAYPYTPARYALTVECGGEHFETQADFLLQSETLSTLIRTFPQMYQERCGGLLAAMVRNTEYDVIEMGDELNASVVPTGEAA